MKALLSLTAEGPVGLSMGELPNPEPAPREVVIEVRACGLNYPDLLLTQDLYQQKPSRPFAPGGEVAGVVAAVGEDVSEFGLGDRVMALVGIGGLAQLVATPVANCTAMPRAMPFEVAAAFLTTFGTAFYALRQRARIQQSESLLVLGASGGVGLAAVMLGHAMGAHIIAAASSDRKLELARHYGASNGLVYPTKVSAEDVKELARTFKRVAGSVDVVFDPVGGSYAEAALRTMAWGGRYLVIGFAAGIPKISLNLALLKGCEIIGALYGAFTEHEPVASAENIRELIAMYEQGRIAPHISATFPLADGKKGFELLATRRASGKIVVIMN